MADDIDSLLPNPEELFEICSEDTDVERDIHRCNLEIYLRIMDVLMEIKELYNSSLNNSMGGQSVFDAIDKIQQIRHDILHTMVADTLHVKAEEEPVSRTLENRFKITDDLSMYRTFRKTPDIIYVESRNKIVWVMDVAVSVSARVVSGIKERKYKKMVEEMNEAMHSNGYGDFNASFFPIVMDQNLSNLDVALLPLNKDLSGRKKQITRILIKECNNLIRDFQSLKLQRTPFELELFHALRTRAIEEESPLVHPLPSLESLKSLEGNKYYEEAKITYQKKHDNYFKLICDEFKNHYGDASSDQLFKNQLFTYPSQKEIQESIMDMEKDAEIEFNHLTKPKPSLHFTLALTERTITHHDGRLDLLQINNLKRLIKKGLSIPEHTKQAISLYKLINEIFEAVPDLDDKEQAEYLKYWSGQEKPPKELNLNIKGTSTVSRSVLHKHQKFLEEYVGLNKVDDKVITKVDSLPFWNERVRDNAESYMFSESMKLAKPRREEEFVKPNKTGIESVDEILDAQHSEVKFIYETINNSQSAYVSKQISEMCQSILIQKKREANHVQILNKGDRGFYVITFPHRMLETKKTGNTVPFICLCLRKESEDVINSEMIEVSFRCQGGFILDVSRGMRLDVPRIESLSHSYELYMSVMLGWMMSSEERPKESIDFLKHSIANCYLFYLCHSVHLRTGGLLDNLRYMFMDVTAEKSNFRMFINDNGKMALKNNIQVALYSRIRKTLPKYSEASKSIRQRDPEYDITLNEVKWGSLGVDNVMIPSLISPGYYFKSFMAATNEIVGLFFAVPKDLHGEFHKMVTLEKIPFTWQVKFNEKERYLLQWEDVLKAIRKGGAEKQTVDLEFVHHVGCWVNEHYLKPRENELLKKLSQIRMQDSLLSHKQFTSSHSCIRKLNKEGYAQRNKVLLSTLERIEDQYEEVPPTLWDFCVDCVRSDEPFRFVISPKGQRTKDDREIYIGNLESFSLRLIEKVFAVVCNFQDNEAIHVAGDKKFINMQSSFRRILNWSRNQLKNKTEKKDAMNKIRKLQEARRIRKEFVESVRGKDWADAVEEQEHITKEEDDIFKSIVGESLSHKKYDNMKEEAKRDKEDAEIVRLSALINISDTDPNIIFMNGDRSKWSAADVCEKFCAYIDALTAIPEQIRILMKSILMKHDDKLMHVSKKLHEKYLTFDDDDRANEFREVCGSKPYGKIKGNWFQGMLNFTSSSFHAGVQEVSWNLIRTELMPDTPTEFIGLCHSDDEIAFLGFGTHDKLSDDYVRVGNLQQNPLQTILLFHNILGTLGSMNYSQKKTNIHLKVSEFVSLFLIWGDQQFPYMKHLATAISGLPGTGLDDDVYSALSQVMMAAMRGCPMSSLLPIVSLAQQRIDRMYSIGKNMHNDVEKIFNIPRQYLPLELGGTFLPGPMPLLLAGPSVHDVCIIKAALENKIPSRDLNMKILKCFYALTPEGLIKSVADDDPLAQAEKYTSSRLSGFQGMIFRNYLPSKRDELLERFTSEMTKEKELEFMIKRPTAAVVKPSTGKDALDYWKMVMTKPAWIRAVRKEGARGMAIKRAQWVKGEHVKLRYDEGWRTLKSCLTEIAEFVNNDEKTLTYDQISLLKSYVYNISSTTSSIIDYLSKIYVKRVKKPDTSIRIADFLNRPPTYRDVKNDVKKVISYIWDPISFAKEFQHVKFADMLPEDIAKIKSFYKPILEREPRNDSEKRIKRFYEIMRKKILNGDNWADAYDKTLSRNFLDENEQDSLYRLVHDVYGEPSWIYKQFEEKFGSRVVITSANNPSYQVVERIIMYNTLRWGVFFMTSGVSQVKKHPTLMPNETAKEDLKFNEVIDTLGLLYKRLAQMRLKNKFLKSIFSNLGMKNEHGVFQSLLELLRKCVRYAVESATITTQCRKIVAVLEVVIIGTTHVANMILVNYKKPLGAWTKEQTHIGGGRYVGEFEYKCWVGDHILTVSGRSTDDPRDMIWTLLCNENSIAFDLIIHAYREIFKETDYNFTKLKPMYAIQNMPTEQICKSQTRWVIKRPTKGDLYIPGIKVNRGNVLLIESLHSAIKLSRSGLELMQTSKHDSKMIKMVSIKHTNTRYNQSQEIIVRPFFNGRMVVDGVDMVSLVKLKLLPAFLTNRMETVSLTDLSRIIVVKKETLTRVNTEKMWETLKSFMRHVPPMPSAPYEEEDFPTICGDDMLESIVQGDFEFDETMLFEEEDYFSEIPIEEDPAADQLSQMSVLERDSYFEALHNRTTKLAPSLYPEMFADTTVRFEIYKSDLNESDIIDDNSSGSSKVSFLETLVKTPGGFLEEKLIHQAIGYSSGKFPEWFELVHYLIEKQREFRNHNWSLKKERNEEFLCRCWELIAEKFCESMYKDEIYLKGVESARLFVRELQKFHKRNAYIYKRFIGNVTDEMIEMTYDVNAEDDDLLL